MSTWTALRSTGLSALFGIVLASASATLRAEPYPVQTIKLVAPFTPGGGGDALTRMVAEQLAAKLGQTIIVENKAGASGGVGAVMVAHEKPNGYTLLIGSAMLAANAVVEGGSAGYDLSKDFEYVGKMGKFDLVMVVSSRLGTENLAGLARLMRTEPSKVSFGSGGVGSPAHLGGELFKLVSHTDALHIPYKGESGALSDLIGGQTTFMLCAPFVCAPRMEDGSLKGLAVAAKQRSMLVPNLPTMAEAGFPGVEAGTWYFMAAPKGTPEAIISKLNTALNEVLADKKFAARLLSMGVEVDPPAPPAAVSTALQEEMNKWRPVVKAANITR